MSNPYIQSTYSPMIDGANLLVVDDDASVRRALRKALELERTTVVEAADGEQAIRVLERDGPERIDAVVTDLVIPTVSGAELIAVLLTCRPALPIVAMSAWVQVPPGLPLVPYLSKPFDPDELIETLAPLVAKSRALQRRIRQSRADAAELHSLAEREHAIASDLLAENRDLRTVLRQFRQWIKPR